MAMPVEASLLEPRDLNGDTIRDAFYDPDINLTWLSNVDVNGLMFWADAVAWAEGFAFAGYDDWRLPTTAQPDLTCSNQGSVSSNCIGSEMGHLWYIELDNTYGTLDNNGGFLNFRNHSYWSGTEYAPDSDNAWSFGMGEGFTTSGLHAAAAELLENAIVGDGLADH